MGQTKLEQAKTDKLDIIVNHQSRLRYKRGDFLGTATVDVEKSRYSHRCRTRTATKTGPTPLEQAKASCTIDEPDFIASYQSKAEI